MCCQVEANTIKLKLESRCNRFYFEKTTTKKNARNKGLMVFLVKSVS
jgi:hypothetical protein